jgi:hypothetical protein
MVRIAKSYAIINWRATVILKLHPMLQFATEIPLSWRKVFGIGSENPLIFLLLDVSIVLREVSSMFVPELSKSLSEASEEI